MPSKASTVNQTLTNYAAGIAQERSSALAEFLAPIVPVGSAVGQYKQFSEKNQFQVVNSRRALGGSAARLSFDATDPTYNCQPHALEIVIDDHERDLAGEGDPLGLERAKVDTLVTSAILSHEDEVLTLVKGSVSATGGIGVWSNAANDPVADIDSQIEAIAIATGRMPNRIVMGLTAWRIFRNHAKVIARQPGAAVVGVNFAQASQMLLNPAIELRIGLLSKDEAKFGKDKSAVNLVGGEVFVFHASPNPTVYDPSFAKTFRTRRGGVEAVRMYREENSRGDVVAVDWSNEIKVVAPACGRRITLS